jgi:hypothetical protein
MYISYRAHFKDKETDISKYGYNAFRIPYDTFLKTRGQHYYDLLSQKVKSDKVLIPLFIATFLDDPQTWIGDIVLNYTHYNSLREIHEGRLGNLSYLFKKDCINMMDRGLKFDPSMGDFVFQQFNQSDIELETFIIFKKMFNFSLDNNTKYNYLYPCKYRKYELLLNVNMKKYKQFLKEVIMSFGN